MFNIQTFRSRTNNLTRTWAANVKAAGGGFETNSLVIANSFLSALLRKSYYSKIIYLLPLLGKGINAARVPLIDKLGIGPATNLNFVDADFSQSVGLNNSSGSFKALDTLISPNALGFTAGIGFWYLSSAFDQYYVFTTTNAAESVRFGLDLRSTATRFYWGAPGNGPIDSNPDTAANYYGQQTTTSNRTLYKNGVLTASDATLDGTSLVSTSLYFMGGNTTVAPYYMTGTGGLGYITDGTLSADEVADLNATLSNYLMKPSGKI